VRRVVRPVREAGVDVELLLVRREDNAVGLYEVIGDNLDVTRFRIDPVDVTLFLLGLGFDALIKAADSVDRIGEPDRTIGSDDRVVRRVQLLAIVVVGDDGDRAVEFGPGDSAAAMPGGVIRILIWSLSKSLKFRSGLPVSRPSPARK